MIHVQTTPEVAKRDIHEKENKSKRQKALKWHIASEMFENLNFLRQCD